MKRYGLSGIYIFDKFPGEEGRQPTCIEDCQKETRTQWLEGLEKEALIRTVNILCETLHNFTEKLVSQGAVSFEEEEEE